MYIGIGYILPKLGDICSDIGYVLPTIGVYILILDIFCQQFGDIWQLEGVCAPFGRWVGENMCQLNIYICIGYILPTFGGYMTVRGCLCALWALGWETKKIIKKISMVSNCTRCQIVRFYTWCQIVRGVKLSWCQIVRCQIVLVSNCPVSNCPRCQIVRCQIVLVSNCPPTWAVSNCPRCQIVLVSNCPGTFLIPWQILQKKL